jgi:hypothetical protein
MRTQGGRVQRTNSKSGHVDCTDKKEKKIFVICKELENGAVAKSYLTNGLLIHVYGEIFAHVLIRKPFLIYDFATAPL